MILIYFFLLVIPFVLAYFLIYYAVKNAMVDANREIAQNKVDQTYRVME
jgi:hypothetical protein